MSQLFDKSRIWEEKMPKKQKQSRRNSKDFYQTWQEASAATQKLGIRTLAEYNLRYKEDPRLPSNPYEFYGKDFPGVPIFLGKAYQPRDRSVKREFYKTWQEAAQGAANLGIMSRRHYAGKYRADPWLPSQPWRQYQDFPGWDEFQRTIQKFREENVRKNGAAIKRDLYPTCKQASKAAQKLGIKSSREYGNRYKEDPHLSSTPQTKYSNFPGWDIFLGKAGDEAEDKPMRTKNYSTWLDAAKAAAKLNIKSMSEYKNRWQEDPQLPGNLYGTYKNFPGVDRFFISILAVRIQLDAAADSAEDGLDSEAVQAEPELETGDLYLTWQAAAEAAAELDIMTRKEYKMAHSEDSQLPVDPEKKYKDFPGWKTFCQTAEKASSAQKSAPKKKGRKKLYQSWKAASRAALRLGISCRPEYIKRYGENSMLPSHPERKYRDWPGWIAFFNGERKSRPRFPPRSEFYATWQEAREAVRELDIRERKEYAIRYREAELLHSRPEQYYKDFPGWDVFFESAEKEQVKDLANEPAQSAEMQESEPKQPVEPEEEAAEPEPEPEQKGDELLPADEIFCFESLSAPLISEKLNGKRLFLSSNHVFLYSGVFQAESSVMLDEMLLESARLRVIMHMHKVFRLNFCEAKIKKVGNNYRLDIAFAYIQGKGVNTEMMRQIGYPYSAILFAEVVAPVLEEDFLSFKYFECVIFTTKS